MILTRSPLRISLGGGGTDLPSYYQEFGSVFLAASIDRYVYTAINRPFEPGFFLKYSKIETVSNVEQIAHPIIREALKFMNFAEDRLEVSSMADIPGGTGLGSSGSFTTSLMLGLNSYFRSFISPTELAELACHIEMNNLGEPIGKQDQYAASIGGMTVFQIDKAGKVTFSPLGMEEVARLHLEDHLLLFYTGKTRSASSVLVDQKQKTESKDSSMVENLHATQEIGIRSIQALRESRLDDFGKLMHEHWTIKKSRSNGMSDDRIDGAYEEARKAGALGGKLVGAGGGGFLMLYSESPTRLRLTMKELGFQETRFRFEFEGSKVLVNE